MFDSFNHPAVYGALIFVLTYVVGYFWYKWDEQREDRRREAIKAAAKFTEAKQDWLADFLTDYAVGDYDEIGVKLAKMVKMARSDTEFKLFLRTSVLAAVTGQLHDENVRKELAAKLEAYGDKVGDTPYVAPKPLIDPRLEEIVKRVIDAKAAVQAAAPVAKTAAELAAAGISLSV